MNDKAVEEGIVSRILDRIYGGILWFTGVSFFFILISVLGGVFYRYVLNSPRVWIEEVNNYLLVCWAFLPAAWILKREGHVVIDLLLYPLSKRKQEYLITLNSFLSVIYLIILLVVSCKWWWELYKDNVYFDGMLNVPQALIIAIIPIGTFLLLIQCVIRTITHWNAIVRKEV